MLTTNKKGFTLIELLIVITIIGLLSGVVIAVINPAKQQARAKDGSLRAGVGKMGIAIDAYYSAKGVVPNATNFIADLQGVDTSNTTQGYDSDNNSNNGTQWVVGANSQNTSYSYAYIKMPGVPVNSNFLSGRVLYYGYPGTGVYSGCLIARANESDNNQDYIVYARGGPAKLCRVTKLYTPPTGSPYYAVSYACNAALNKTSYGTCKVD